jgi:hypothetical protein
MKSDKYTETKAITNAIHKINTPENLKWIIILPGLGCDGCIQEGEDFLINQIENKELLFVLTKIASLKILELKTRLKVEDHPNIYIDKENIFSIPTENNIYPCIIYLKNKKIISHEFQSPKNSQALLKLKSLIKHN